MKTYPLQITISVILFLLVFILPYRIAAQPGCNETYALALGSVIDNEKGYSLAASHQDQVLYLGGLKNDSVAILRISVDGQIEWTRTFDFIPGRADHLHGFMLDSEDMIVGLGGTEGPAPASTAFAFRYNPRTNSILWAKEYRSSFNNFTSGIYEMFPGGDYVMVNNPHTSSGTNDAELVRLNRSNGTIVSSFARQYDLGGSESLGDFVSHGGFMYSSGRFTDGMLASDMRNTLIKIDPVNGIPEWTLLGHRSASANARLYGVDMVIDQDAIFSVSLGDPNGSSISTTQIYVQRTNLDGQVLWIKQYDLPGTNDWVDEIISSNDGFVIMARNRVSPSDIILFKVDRLGNLLWSKKYDFSDNDNSVSIGTVQSQLIEFNGYLYFTAQTAKNGRFDMLLVKTNLQGEISDTCFNVEDVVLTVIPVNNPDFYFVTPIIKSASMQTVNLSVSAGSVSQILITEICMTIKQLEAEIIATICNDESYDGYSVSGVYIDHFTTPDGCDSIRTLILTVLESDNFEIIKQVCGTEVYEGYSETGTYIDTFQNVNGCDSIRVLHLITQPVIQTIVNQAICPGQVFEGYGEMGIYTDTFHLHQGCDSIRVLHLDVTFEIHTGLDTSICWGQSFEQYSQSGIYIDTLPSFFGCDSIRTLNLDVYVTEKFDFISICSGSQFNGYLVSGHYQDTLEGVHGACDTMYFLELNVLPPEHAFVSQHICQGEQYFGYGQAGVYTDSLQTMEGCDSVRTVELEILPIGHSEVVAAHCEGSQYGYATPGMYIDTLVSSLGCDSIRILHLEGSVSYIPNIFSPNGDQINDVFEISTFPEGVSGFEYFAIFDRFGDKVYETSARPIRWDGKNKVSGRYFNPGVYTWVWSTICNTKHVLKHGNITLLR